MRFLKQNKKHRICRLFQRTVGSDICHSGKRYALTACDMLYSSLQKQDMYKARYVRFANEGKYHIALSVAKYISSACHYIAFCRQAKYIAFTEFETQFPAFRGIRKKYRLK